jgi:hypothetical protein
METKINTYIPYGKCFINNNIGNRVGELNDYLECNEYPRKNDEFKNNGLLINFNNENGEDLQNNLINITLNSNWSNENMNPYIALAASITHSVPDATMSVFFSDSNIAHLQNQIINNVQEITSKSGINRSDIAKGVLLQKPDINELWSFMINAYVNYKIYNGSICFVHQRNKNNSIKADISRLNTNLLQEYISKVVSQINMYVQYYKDASELPEQLDIPKYTSMKGSKTLEYNVAFQSGNSMNVARFNESGNVWW